MNLTAKVDVARAQAKIRSIGRVLSRPLINTLDGGARVAAISCAKSSQPYGTGADALQKGRSRTEIDIRKVYATPGKAWADISSRPMKSLFWKALKAGETSEAELILNNYGHNLRGVSIGSFDGGSLHKSARNTTTGRVQISQPKLIVTNGKAVEGYISKRQQKVGFGKGGWADAARAIGGSIRGLRDAGDITANWILRHRAGLSRISRGGSGPNPTVVIQSTVRYASEILKSAAKTEAVRIARERMIKALLNEVRYEPKFPRAK